MPEDELAAIATALAVLTNDAAQASAPVTPPSRWKRADRNPELEMEEIRALR
jgi:hypothetical protein